MMTKEQVDNLNTLIHIVKQTTRRCQCTQNQRDNGHSAYCLVPNIEMLLRAIDGLYALANPLPEKEVK